MRVEWRLWKVTNVAAAKLSCTSCYKGCLTGGLHKEEENANLDFQNNRIHAPCCYNTSSPIFYQSCMVGYLCLGSRSAGNIINQIFAEVVTLPISPYWFTGVSNAWCNIASANDSWNRQIEDTFFSKRPSYPVHAQSRIMDTVIKTALVCQNKIVGKIT